jgi:hypothetical protein
MVFAGTDATGTGPGAIDRFGGALGWGVYPHRREICDDVERAAVATNDARSLHAPETVAGWPSGSQVPEPAGITTLSPYLP